MLLDKIKKIQGINHDEFDDTIKMWIQAAEIDLKSVGIVDTLVDNYDSLVQIRELTDMNQIQNVLVYFLSGRYSNNLINFLIKMIEVDENKRPDFIQLENMLVQKNN